MQASELNRRIGEARFNRFHGLVLFWGILILIIDGYDLAVVGAALPAIMEDMNVDATSAGFMASSALFGMMVGAIAFGTLADRIGRRISISMCIAVLSIFTAAAGLTHDPVTFSITRFIAGLGIGGAVPIITAQMSEFAPVKLRSRLVTLVFAGYSIGGIIVALIGKQLIESYGWQSVFFCALVPLALIPFVLKTMPESISYLIRTGEDAELRSTASKLVPGLILDDHEKIIASSEVQQADKPVARLFENGRRSSTLLIWLAFIMGLFMTYALSSWLAKLMGMAGYNLGSALNFLIVFNLGAVSGAVLGGWLGDKFNIKLVLIAFYILGAVSLTLMGYTKTTSLLFVIVFVVGASTLGTQLLAYAYAASYYPTAIRSTGVGFATGIGRLGAIAAPIVIGFLVSLELPLEQNFMAIALAGLLGAVAIILVDQSKSTAVQDAVDRERHKNRLAAKTLQS